MSKYYKHISLIALFLAFVSSSFGQVKPKSIVEITGVVLADDSIHPVANAVVSVLNKNKGVVANVAGIYSLVVYPGDTLLFESVGFKNAYFVLPENYQERYYNRVQLMKQDTFYLPETVVGGLPTGDAFIYAFKYWPIVISPEDLALSRLSPDEISRILTTLPMDGAENYSLYKQYQVVDGQYYGQVRSMSGLLNPMAWAQFFDAWKRGDFRKKK